MSKELFMEAHEQLVAEYMEEHPDADESAVYEMMADRAHDRMCDNLAARIDAARDAARDRDVP